jgi:LuxR family transcriptional regulator, maltose regulon positive regulatory protein
MRIPLLKSKLSMPPVNAGHVVRPRLIERLKQGLDSKLTLVSAPAGYGKTTLLSAWAARCGIPVAWLTLDSGDDDPVRFVTYLVTALHSMGADHAQKMQKIMDALASFQPFNAVYWMSGILEQLEVLPDKFILILEDYHAISNSEIHEVINFLLDHQPPQMHLVISTRVDPPLLVAKIRARGQLNELRQADLRFTIPETNAFVTQWIGSELLPGDFSALSNRTEGWVAGLQMACLALQNAASQSREEISRMIANFGGSHEYIVDFFATEILAHQPELVRSFLLQTSILDPLCGELCNVVTGRADGQSMLVHLQKANLFVIPLDQERQWYRYHTLFSDLLRKLLHQETPEMVSELHHRASLWYEANELFDPAFQHACSSGDQSRVAWLVNEYSESLWKMGDFHVMLRWIDKLSEEQLFLRPELLIGKALMLSEKGDYRQAKSLLAEVQQKMTDKMSAASAEQCDLDLNNFLHPQNILGLVNVAAAHLASLQGEYELAVQKANQALDLLSKFQIPWDIPWKCVALISLSHALWIIGDGAIAIQHLNEAMALSNSYEHHQQFLFALTDQALFYMLQDRFDQAAQVCQDGLAYIKEHDLERYPISARLLITRGLILCEQGDLELAEPFLQRGLGLSQAGYDDTVHWLGLLALGRFWMVKGYPDKANAYLQEAQSLAEKKYVLSPWLSTVLSQGFLAQALLPKSGGMATQIALVKPNIHSTTNLLVERLSERECEVLHLLAEGLSNQQIAGRLYLSIRTVKFHTGNIYSKLGVTRRTEAIARAHTLGLLS